MQVDVVTRTKDRPRFLERCAESIGNQTHEDIVWTVVNDGGDAKAVERIVAASGIDEPRRRVIHHDTSLGMEPAAAAGVAAGNAPAIAIHDDDDSWSAAFLSTLTATLARFPAASGVISWVDQVTERLGDAGPERLGTEEAVFAPETVHFGNLALRNQFPPIGFLFRRSAHDAAGGIDPSLSLLGDWDLALRLLLEGDILVVPQALASYHLRETGSASGNSVTTRKDEHRTARAALINRYFRSPKTRHERLGHLLAAAAVEEEMARLTAPSARLSRLRRRLGL